MELETLSGERSSGRNFSVFYFFLPFYQGIIESTVKDFVNFILTTKLSNKIAKKFLRFPYLNSKIAETQQKNVQL